MTEEVTIHMYRDLPGVKKKTLKGPFVYNTTEVKKYLDKYRIVSHAGDHGALNIYIDDDKKYRCIFMRYLSIVNEKIVDTKAETIPWFKIYRLKCVEG